MIVVGLDHMSDYVIIGAIMVEGDTGDVEIWHDLKDDVLIAITKGGAEWISRVG